MGNALLDVIFFLGAFLVKLPYLKRKAMNGQDRQRIQEMIQEAQEGQVHVIKLDEFGVMMFRNIYNEATIAGLKITILERGKVFQIERS